MDVKKHHSVRVIARQRNVTIVCIKHNNETVRHLSWSPDQLVNWLLNSDYHFILSHVHQGMTHWNPIEVLAALLRLSEHLGFPSGLSLTCPIFLQDKALYIKGK